MTSQDEKIYQIKISFAEVAEGVKVKREVLDWLTDQPKFQVVESVYDGLDDQYAESEPDDEVNDSLPIVVYGTEFTDCLILCTIVARDIEPQIKFDIDELPSQGGFSAWNTESDIFRTDRFLILPNGREPQDLGGLNPVWINRGNAFGNGQHVSTLAILRAMEQMKIPENGRILDVGTGTGLLLICAQRLGFKTLYGTDLLPEIVEEARANLLANHVEAELQVSESVSEHLKFDWILANIPIAGVRPLLNEIDQSLNPYGLVFLAGFTAKDAKKFSPELLRIGWVLIAEIIESEWSCLVLQTQKTL